MYFCEYLYYINIPYRSRLRGRQNPPSVTELNNSSGSILSAHQPTSTFSNAHRRPKVRLSLVVEPFFQCSLPYGAKNKKNSQTGAFLFWYAHRDWLRRHGAHSLMLTGVLKSAFRLWSNPSSSVLSLMALKTKKTPKRELFCFGTRTGIRTLDPLIKSQLL